MNVHELIEKHYENWKLLPEGPMKKCMKEFAIELLERVYPAGPTNSIEVLRNIDKALEELRK